MRVLAIVAHPDDETLGCGGTLARHAAAGDAVSVMTFTDGVGSRPNVADSAAASRRDDFGRALAALGVDFDIHTDLNVYAWQAPDLVDARGAGWRHESFRDQELDDIPIRTLARCADAWIRRFTPDVVYTHWPYDLNQDHRAAAQAVLIATRPTSSYRVRAVYACETPSATEWAFGAAPFAPSLFVDISETIERKIAAMVCYGLEAGDWPHPRSLDKLRALASVRGAAAGVGYAEAFVVLRKIVGLSGAVDV